MKYKDLNPFNKEDKKTAFNWGAFLLTPIYSIRWGAWGFLLLWLLFVAPMRIIDIQVLNNVFSHLLNILATIAVGVLSAIYAPLSVIRYREEKTGKKMAADETDRFWEKQNIWNTVGFILMVVWLLYIIVSFFQI